MITLEYIKSILHYNPETGVFTYIKPMIKAKIGDVAGWVNYKGYLILALRSRHYRQHRVAWFYMTGEWPKGQIDHKDNNKQNNKWRNLREADNQLNHYNLNKPKNNTSGAKGVRQNKSKKYEARIKFNKKEIWIGSYPTLEEASNAYLTKAKELAAEFANRGH